MSITWRDTMATGAPVLDADHQQFVKIVNAMEAAIAADRLAIINPTFDLLFNYMSEHFAREEKILAAIKFPGLAQHRQMHQELEDTARTLSAHFKAAVEPTSRKDRANTVLAFLQQWLLQHILQEDQKMKPYLPKKMAAVDPDLGDSSIPAFVERMGLPPIIKREKPVKTGDEDVEYALPPHLAHLLERMVYVIPAVGPPMGQMPSFERLCEAAIIRRIDKVLLFFQRHNPALPRPLPPFYLASPEFADKFHAAVIELIFPFLRNIRQIRVLSASFNWSINDTETFWEHVNAQLASAIKDGWNAAWDELRTVEVKRDEGTVTLVKNGTKRLREMLAPSTPDAYDMPKIGNREIETFRTLLDPVNDWWVKLEKGWRVCQDLYEQEQDPRVFQQKAREGALRDNLLKAFTLFPDQWADFMVLACHRVFPRISSDFLQHFTTNFGTNEADRESCVPYTIRYLRQVRAHPTFKAQERQIEEDWQRQMTELRSFLRGEDRDVVRE